MNNTSIASLSRIKSKVLLIACTMFVMALPLSAHSIIRGELFECPNRQEPSKEKVPVAETEQQKFILGWLEYARALNQREKELVRPGQPVTMKVRGKQRTIRRLGFTHTARHEWTLWVDAGEVFTSGRVSKPIVYSIGKIKYNNVYTANDTDFQKLVSLFPVLASPPQQQSKKTDGPRLYKE
jgi:hypothetical protein